MKEGRKNEREGRDVLPCLASASQAYPDKDTVSSGRGFSFSLCWLLFKWSSPFRSQNLSDSLDSGSQSSRCRSSGKVWTSSLHVPICRLVTCSCLWKGLMPMTEPVPMSGLLWLAHSHTGSAETRVGADGSQTEIVTGGANKPWNHTWLLYVTWKCYR